MKHTYVKYAATSKTNLEYANNAKISTISHMATAHAADVVNQLVVAHVAV